MLNFEPFNFPTDGLTRVGDLDGYAADRLRDSGWSCVGIATAPDDEGKPKAYGVYRMTDSEALKAEIDKRKAAEKIAADDRTERAKLDRLLADANRRNAELLERLETATASPLEPLPQQEPDDTTPM